PQSLEYEVPQSPFAVPLLGILALIGAGWWLSRQEKWRVPGLCILAFLLLLAPTSSFIPSADVAFEHRLYLPILAFSVFASYLLSKTPHRTIIGMLILAALSVLTIRRESVWSSEIALWEDTARRAPGKARVWFNLGGSYLSVDSEKARSALMRALSLKP